MSTNEENSNSASLVASNNNIIIDTNASDNNRSSSSSAAVANNNNYDTTSGNNQQQHRPFVKNPLGNAKLPCSRNGVYCSTFALSTQLLVICTVISVTTCFIIFVPNEGEVWSRVVSAILGFISISSCLVGSMIDPGIILPKREGDLEPLPQKVKIEGIEGEVDLEVCRTCKILRPPRSSHGRLSNVCTHFYDHECSVSSTVVAQRSWRFFVFFYYSTAAAATFIVIRTIIHLIVDGENKSSGFQQARTVISILLLVVCIPGICCTLPGSCAYTAMSCSASTQKDAKGRKHFLSERRMHECSCKNYCDMLCGEMPESELNNMTDQDYDDWAHENQLCDF